MAQGLGLQALARDLGFEVALTLHSDATAAIGIARRRGMGKIRHLDCTDLWVAIRWVRKNPGTESPADILTTYVDHSILTSALKRLNLKFMEGRPACAPAAMGIHQSTNPDIATSSGQ